MITRDKFVEIMLEEGISSDRIARLADRLFPEPGWMIYPETLIARLAAIAVA